MRSTPQLLDETGRTSHCLAFWKDSRDEPWRGGKGAPLETQRMRKVFAEAREKGQLRHRFYRYTPVEIDETTRERRRQKRKARLTAMSPAQRQALKEARALRRKMRRKRIQDSQGRRDRRRKRKEEARESAAREN